MRMLENKIGFLPVISDSLPYKGERLRKKMRLRDITEW